MKYYRSVEKIITFHITAKTIKTRHIKNRHIKFIEYVCFYYVLCQNFKHAKTLTLSDKIPFTGIVSISYMGMELERMLFMYDYVKYQSPIWV